MPHDPTTSGPPHHTPSTCYVCSRRATGIGLAGFGWNGDQDPHFVCPQCVPLIEQLKSMTKFDVYEENAIAATVEALGPLVEEFGFDMSEWSAEQAERFVAEVVLGFGHSIRTQIRENEVPF